MFKTKTATETFTTHASESMKIKKKKSGIFKKTVIGVVIAAASLAIFGGVKVNNIQNVINHNTTYFESVATPQSAERVLFSDTYTDADFNKDLKNFEVLNVNNEKNKTMFMFMNFSNMQKHSDKVSIEEYTQLLNEQDLSKFKSFSERVPKKDTLSWSLVTMGISPMNMYFHDQVAKAYEEKYGADSYFKYFMNNTSFTNVNGEISVNESKSQTNKEFLASQEAVTIKLKEAYAKKDYAMLRTYFEQYHHFLNFVDGVNHSAISTPRYKESNPTDSFIATAVLIPYLNAKNNYDMNKTSKDLIMATY